MSNTPVIGIDLGTTFCAVATIDEMGKPVVLKNSDGKNLTPSVIAFMPDRIAFGDEAKGFQSLGEENIASFFKRHIGEQSFYLEFHGKRYDATALSGLLLGKLKTDAEATLGKPVSQAVITVPAYFNNFQREATVQAGKLAGLDVLRIINEPTAAAIAYGIDKNRGDQTLLIYDLGGGTFDVTLIRTTAGSIQVIATDGDHQLGGKDWDGRIMQHVADQFREEFGCDPLTDVETLNDLLVQCENAKKSLSQATTARIKIFFDGHKGSYAIAREQFDEMTADLLERTKTLCHTVLADAKKTWADHTEETMSWTDIDGVLLVGGSTRMPQVITAVESMSGKRAIHGINIDEAVAIGAAIQAEMDREANAPAKLAGRPATNMLAGRKTIRDVTSHSLGMIAENADRSQYVNAIILSRNSPIPGKETRPLAFRTSAKKDMECDVYLLQGESEHPGECAILGKYVFSKITHEKDGKAVLEITYNYDKNGIVAVSGVQQSTGKPLAMRVEPVPDDMSWIYESPRDREGAGGEYGHVTVIIAVDCSGSMTGHPMREAQKAAKKFLEKIDLSHFSIGIMAVADSTKMLVDPSQNAKDIEKAIDGLTHKYLWVGGGNTGQPFTDAKKILAPLNGTKFLIVLADGQWSHENHAVSEAKKCHAANIGVIAIGFGFANKRFLQQIASCDENALFTDMSKLGDSFSTIAQVLTQRGGGQGRIFAK
ncbi:MAG: Hsp70 family protein [Planctomycetaceae bacterium]|nr:Hsp70 family protein [Planctomycetaceae bacterium]